jgi:hypothetical protein
MKNPLHASAFSPACRLEFASVRGPSFLLAKALLLLLCLSAPSCAQPGQPAGTSPSPAAEATSSAAGERGKTAGGPGASSSNDRREDVLALWNTAVQTLTLIVVLFYTMVTRQMQKVMARQIKLGVMPSFILGLVQSNQKDATLDVNTFALQITNVGSGTALNIEVGAVPLHRLNKNRRKLGEPNLRFNVLGLLRRDEKALMKHRSFSAGQPIDEDLMVDLEEQYVNPGSAGIPFTISFQDIEGDWYQQTIRVSHAGSHPSAVKHLNHKKGDRG